jgi:hypothetical protein
LCDRRCHGSRECTSRISNAAYKVHVTKSDGTHVFVVEDSGFNVLAVKSAHRHGRHRFDEAGHGDRLRHHGVGAHRS